MPHQLSLIKLIFIILACAGLSSCGFIKRNTIGLVLEDKPAATKSEPEQDFQSPVQELKQAPKTTKVDIEKLQIEDKKQGSVEILWQMPTEEVDGYLIKYGFSSDKLEFQVELAKKDIEIFEDKQHGSVYRYVIEKIPSDKTVFIAMATMQGTETSKLSETFTLKAE